MRIFEPRQLPESTSLLGKIGRAVEHNIHASGKGCLILFESLSYSHRLLRRREEFSRQMMNVGVKTFFITAVVALFTGMIMSLQIGLALQDFSQEGNVGTFVTQSICREMGPFMTALILAASVGSAYAAEFGTMTVSEEVSALQVMGIDPLDYLVMPRLWAMMIMCPVLTIYTDLIAVWGGLVVASNQLDVSTETYYEGVLNLLKQKEIYVGLLKAWIFGVIIVVVSAYKGFSTTDGAVGVGRATRRSVVTSFLLILISGYYVTRAFY